MTMLLLLTACLPAWPVAEQPCSSEVCDGVDNDCNGTIDDNSADAPPWFGDIDGDTFGDSADVQVACQPVPGTYSNGDFVVEYAYVENAGDCAPLDAGAYPGAAEYCDEVDTDCDGDLDSGAKDAVTTYTDADADGYGDTATAEARCDPDGGEALVGGDCDDADAEANPGAEELCDGRDNDCDGGVDEDGACF